MKKCRMIILFCLIVLFLLFGLYLINVENNVIDDSIYKFIISFKCDFLTLFFKVITFMASVPFIVFVCLCLLFFKKILYRKIILINIINDGVINLVLKNIFKRNRPLDIMMITESGYSFPSGHAMISCVFYGFFIYLIYKSNISFRNKVFGIIIISMLILLIGISRIYLGVHFATDVICGYIVGICYLLIAIGIIDKNRVYK